MKRTGYLVTALAAATLLSSATPASASGTVHYSDPEQCYTDDDSGYLICYSTSGQYHSTVTPSGNGSYVGKGTSHYTATGPGPSYESSYSYSLHYLAKPGDTHVESVRSAEAFTTDGQTCYYTDHFHFANGEIQFDRPTLECS